MKENIDESAGDLVESLNSKQARIFGELDTGELQYTTITITITIEFICRTLYIIFKIMKKIFSGLNYEPPVSSTIDLKFVQSLDRLFANHPRY